MNLTDATTAFPLGEPTSPGAMGRVLLTFSAPRRAFTGLRSGGSWWLPYLLVLLVGVGYVGSIGSRVGWEAVSRNNLASSPKQQARFDQASPVQQEQQIAVIARVTRTIAFAAPVVSPLLAGAVVAAVLLATFRFGMGAPVSFGSLFAVYMFSALVPALKALLETSLLLSGVGVESFQINNPLGSNPAFYLQGSALPHPLLAALSWLDVFTIWQLVVLAIGCAVVAKVSLSRSAGVVFGWTAIVMLLSVAAAALT